MTNNKGDLKITRSLILGNLTTAERDALTPINGMVIFNTTTNQEEVYNGSWVSSSGVLSVFGRTGVVTAQNGDYTASQVTNVATGGITSTDVQGAINELDTEKLTITLADGKIWVGNGSNVATAVTPSGDVTITNTGVNTIANLAVTNAKIANATIDLTTKVTGILPNVNTTATSLNTASTIVARDGSGNFAAGTITATLSGNATSASTVSTSNEAADTTCFPLFVTASGTQTLEPKNNINLRYNASSNLLSVNLAVIDNGGAAFPTISAISALKFGDALGAGSYIGYGGPQFPRSTGVSSTGSLYHARNTFYNPVISDFSYGVSGSGVTLLELADTAINLKYAASGTVGNPVTFTTGFSMSQSTGISTIRGVNIDNGGAALTGTNTPLTFAGSLARGNYINLGTSGRNIGVVSGGNAFLSANLDYNSTTPGYVYNSSNAATAIELGQAGISFKYAVAGTAGNAVTPTTAMFLDSANGRIGINKSNPTYVLEVGGGADNTTQVAFSGGSTTCHFTPTSTSFRLGSLTSGKSLSLEYSNAQAGIVIDGSSGDVTISAGNLIVNTAGKTLKVKEGSNACKGTGATMVGGTVTVNTTAVATGDQILLTKTAAGGTSTTGMPVITIVNGTSFTITGGALDTSTWSWLIVKAA